MVYVGDLTSDQIDSVEAEVVKRMMACFLPKCTCPPEDASRGHAPECPRILAEEQAYDYLFEQVVEEWGWGDV